MMGVIVGDNINEISHVKRSEVDVNSYPIP